MVKFKVRDRDHVIGIVLLSLTNLGSHRESSKKWLPLTPHKKGHEASGELLIECFVSQYRPGQVLSLSETSSPISSRMGSQEDIHNFKTRKRFSIHRRTPSWSKGSTGSTDGGASAGPSSKGEGDSALESSSLSKQASETSSTSASGGASEDSLRPQVTGISPHEGPVQGGQRVVLRGSNLGNDKESVLKVLLADVNCTNSLEYFSPSKLLVKKFSR